MVPSYNGYTGKERNAKQRAMNLLKKLGTYRALDGPCSLCGDPEARIEPHSEDYSEPYIWEPPAEYPLCRRCHVVHVHQRFSKPDRWERFKGHVRRGGYAREFDDAVVKRELQQSSTLRQLRERSLSGDEWWERLTSDPASLTAEWARPRP